MSVENLKSLSCPNCGAPLEFARHQTALRCAFCGSHIERSNEALSDLEQGQMLKVDLVSGRIAATRSSHARHFVIKMQDGQPVVIASGEPSASASVSAALGAPTAGRSKQRPGGCGALLIVLLFIFLVVGLPFGLAFFNVKQVAQVIQILFSGNLAGVQGVVSTVNKRILVRSSGAFIPSTTDGPPDLVVLTSQYPKSGGDDELRLVALSSTEPKMLWQSEALGKDVYSAPILADQKFVYTLADKQLLALRRADGQTAWMATLSDKVELNICRDCLRLHASRIFALSNDGALQAFDAHSGTPLWSFVATEDSPRGLYLLDGYPAFMDRVDYKGMLRVFDPATGQMRTEQPACASRSGSDRLEYADWTTPLYMSPDEASFYIVFDSSAPCVQKRNSKTLAEAWSVPLSDSTLYDSAVLIDQDTLYISSDQNVFALNVVNGQPGATYTDPDYRLVPLVIAGDSLIVRARRTRGSEQWELWALGTKPASAPGASKQWTFDLDDSPPLDPPDAFGSSISDGESAWTWHLASSGLAVMRFEAAADDVSHAILLDTLNVQTGVAGGTKRIPLDIKTIILSAPTVLDRRGDVVWLFVENQVIGFDAAAAKIIYRWP